MEVCVGRSEGDLPVPMLLRLQYRPLRSACLEICTVARNLGSCSSAIVIRRTALEFHKISGILRSYNERKWNTLLIHSCTVV